MQMERYIYKRRSDGINVINLEKTYEKMQLAARVIVAIENPQVRSIFRVSRSTASLVGVGHENGAHGDGISMAPRSAARRIDGSRRPEEEDALAATRRKAINAHATSAD